MKSLSAKLSILYIFMAIVNITFFTITTFENQIDLISSITKFETKEMGNTIYSQLNAVIKDVNNSTDSVTTGDFVTMLREKIQNIVGELVFFNEEGKILYQSNPQFQITEAHSENAKRAYANNEFVGQFYYPVINENNHEILFYVPVSTNNKAIEEFLMLFKLEILDINNRLGTLYKLIVIFIIIITLFHMFFGFFLNRLILAPLKSLTARSAEISEGNYTARVLVKSRDEIGNLGQSFNKMAASIEDTITQLNRKNEVMRKEMQMAARVQKSIYPDLRQTSIFNIAIYHRPFIEVSGDYHNVIPLDENRYGIIVADVAGHGVSAALITMLIKDQFEGIAPQYKDSKELMEQINNAFDNLMTDFDKFFTAFYLIIDKNKVITFSNAAHPRSFVLRPGARGYKILDTDGVFIGLPAFVHRSFNSKSIRLRSGDKIVLYTDGVTESQNRYQQEYSSERLYKTAIEYVHLPCDIMLNKIIADFHEFCDPEKRRDDETLIIIQMKD